MKPEKNTISRHDALKVLLENEEMDVTVKEQLASLNAKFDLILSLFVVQQKDFCAINGISPDTLRTKVLSGDIEVLQTDGSRLNYIPLKASENLKPRRKRKR